MWAYKANQQAAESLERIKQFNLAWYQYSTNPNNTKLHRDPKSGMYILALEVHPCDDIGANLKDEVKHNEG